MKNPQMIAEVREQVSESFNGTGVYTATVEHLTAAYRLVQQTGNPFVSYLVEMALIEVNDLLHDTVGQARRTDKQAG